METALRSNINVRLNFGNHGGSGAMIVRTVPLGRVIRNANITKVMSVLNALAPIFAHPIFRIERHEVTILEN
jgi:hypothetical protein